MHLLGGPCHCGETHCAEPRTANANCVDGRPGTREPDFAPKLVVCEREWKIRDTPGRVRAVHVRRDYDDGTKGFLWKQPDGTWGLGGVAAPDLPPYGAHAWQPGRPTIHVEGEQARDALAPLAEPLGYNVVGHVTGAPSIHSPDVLRHILSPRHFLWADSDDVGETQMARTQWTLRELMRNERGIPLRQSKDAIRWIDWPGARPGEGDDAADFVAQGGTGEELRHLLDEASAWNADAGQRADASGVTSIGPGPAPPRVFTAASLQGKTFPSLPWAVPGVLPQGAALLCGPPKIGKSRLILQLACAVAYGGVALSHTEVAQGGVLVLALEDGERRLQARLSALLSDEKAPWPQGLAFATEWRSLDQGGAEELDAYLIEHPETRLVIVDVLQMIRPPTSGKQTAYATDFAAMRALKAIADRHDVTVLVVHHTRKMDANDPLDLVSGTNGLAGAVDSVLILQREPNGADATLYLRGRDVEEAQFTLAYDRERGAWNVASAAPTQPLSETREKIFTALEQVWPNTMAPKEIAAATGLSEQVVHQRLHHLEGAGRIRRVKRGQYTLINPPKTSEPGPDELIPLSPRNDRKDRKDGENPAQPPTFLVAPILTGAWATRKDDDAVPDDDVDRKDGCMDETSRNDADVTSDLTNLTVLTTWGEAPDAGGSAAPFEEVVL
jgi:hypothetical protein